MWTPSLCPRLVRRWLYDSHRSQTSSIPSHSSESTSPIPTPPPSCLPLPSPAWRPTNQWNSQEVIRKAKNSCKNVRLILNSLSPLLQTEQGLLSSLPTSKAQPLRLEETVYHLYPQPNGHLRWILKYTSMRPMAIPIKSQNTLTN